jgi:hypothetical protein
MKYMITWSERSQGSAIEYENAQKRILDVFRRWEAPANFKIELFVIRVGDWGGYMLADCDDPSPSTSFAPCSRLSNSRQGRLFPSRTRFAANLKSWLGAMV